MPSHLPSATFCWLPPDSLPAWLLRRVVAISKKAARRFASSSSRRRLSRPADRDPPDGRCGQVLDQAADGEDAVPLAVVGTVGDAARHRLAHVARVERPAFDLHRAAMERNGAGHGADHGIRAAAELAGKAEYLALVEIERDRPGEPLHQHIVETQYRLAARRSSRGEHLVEPAPEKMLDQFVDVERFDFDRIETRAVAEDGHAVCQFEHLAEPVGDVDDRPAFARQRSHDRHHLFDLDVGERRSRLVEDEDARIPGQEARDLDELPLRHGKVPGRHGRVDIAEPDKIEIGPDALGQLAARPDRRGIPAETDVLGHRERGNDAELLRDVGDAGMERLMRRAEADGASVDFDRAGVRGVRDRRGS